MKNFYDAPEFKILEIKTDSEICGPSQAEITNPGVGDPDGDLI